MTDYNYANFPQDLEENVFNAFRDAIRVGGSAPDGTLVDAETGASVQLSSLWKKNSLMVEFGSHS